MAKFSSSEEKVELTFRDRRADFVDGIFFLLSSCVNIVGSGEAISSGIDSILSETRGWVSKLLYNVSLAFFCAQCEEIAALGSSS